MQPVLSIDLSCDPAWAELVDVEGKEPKVIEAHSSALPSLLEYIFSSPQTPALDTAANETAVANTAPGSEPPSKAIPAPIQELKFLLAKFRGAWVNTVIILPTPDYLTLNLELPFADPKQLSKVLPLEVQDRIPFDIQEFLVEYKVLGNYSAGANASNKDGGSKESSHKSVVEKDIHVSLFPKRCVRRLLEVCKKVDLEPRIVSSPSTFIAGALALAPEYFSSNCALVYPTAQSLYITIVRDGQLVGDRVIHRPGTTAQNANTLNIDDQTSTVQRQKEMLVDLKLTLSSFESRYGQPITKVYLFGSTPTREEVQQIISRSVETISVAELTRQTPPGGASQYSGLATLSALFVKEMEAPLPLVNFRAHEFAYSPRLMELMRSARDLAPYLLFVVLLAMLTFSATYYTRARYVSQLDAAVGEKIRSTLVGAEIVPGQEVESLHSNINRLQMQLKDLGSLSRYSPLDAFTEASKDFPRLPGVSVRAVNIKNNRIKVEGIAPEYGTADKIDRVFNSKKETYARAKSEVSSAPVPGGTGRAFTLEIYLPE